MAKILIIEDNVDLAETVKNWLDLDHHDVELVSDGMLGLQQLRAYSYDLAILDWQLPKLPGIDVLRQHRAEGGRTPVLMLTGMNSLDDKERGLETGADDYLTKPFEMRELCARVRAIIRRSSGAPAGCLSVRDLRLELDMHRLVKSGTEIKLSPREFEVIEFFMKNPNRVFSAEAILNRVWTNDSEATPSTVRTFIKQLRKKLHTDGENPVIENVHGVGYRLVNDLPS